jgi:hypothetical protein
MMISQLRWCNASPTSAADVDGCKQVGREWTKGAGVVVSQTCRHDTIVPRAGHATEDDTRAKSGKQLGGGAFETNRFSTEFETAGKNGMCVTMSATSSILERDLSFRMRQQNESIQPYQFKQPSKVQMFVGRVVRVL